MTITPKEQLENLLKQVLLDDDQLAVDDETITVATDNTHDFIYRFAYEVGRVSERMSANDFEMAVKFRVAALNFEVVDYQRHKSTIQWTF